MDISVDFLKDFGICDEALAAHIERFGTEVQRYWVVYDAIAESIDAGINDPSWLPWMDNLQSRVEAVKWWGNYTEHNEWRLINAEDEFEYFYDLDEALARQAELIQHSYDQVKSVSSYDAATGTVYDFDVDAPGYIVYNPVTGLNTTIVASDLDATTSAIEEEYRQFIHPSYAISRKITEPDDGMVAWEVVA